MSHSILIIPSYNEETRLPAVLDGIRAAAPEVEIVVVDDGSADATSDVARARGATVLRHPFNLGYGAALQTGYKHALYVGAEIVIQMDADGQHDPAQLSTLSGPIEADELDLVIGSRFLEETGYEMGVLRSLGRKVFISLARIAGLSVSDPTSGYQAMNRHVLEVYAADFFPTDYPDVDVLLACKAHGLRVGERPVHMLPSPRASTMHGGLRSIYYVYKMLLSVFASTGIKHSR